MQWVIDIYTLVLASLLLLSGATGDRFGRRRMFQIGLAVFAIGSLLCSLAPNIETLIAARFLQAVGGSMMNPVAMSIITQVFTGRVERARAIGVWGAVVGISMALGPIVGGALIEYVGWRAVFWINLPICALAILLTAIFVPESEVGDHARHRPGRPGARRWRSCSASSSSSSRARRWAGPTPASSPWPWSRPWRSSASCATSRGATTRSSICGSSAASRSRRRRVIAVCAFAAWGAFLFMMSLYLQGERGYLGHAHRTDLSAGCRWRAGLLAAVGPAGRAATAAGRRSLIAGRPDHRGDVDARPL